MIFNSPSWQLRTARRVLHAGGVIAYPTESVYGLGCDPTNAGAVIRLLGMKQRRMEKGLILIASHYKQLLRYIEPLDKDRMQKILQTWPGPVTWLLPARPDVPVWLRGAHNTLAVRVTAHPLAATLCKVFGGPLVSTSANPAGQPAARSALQVRRMFGDELDLVISGKTGPSRHPTEIRDGTTGHIIRPGQP